jgi:hypothetical protein
MRLAMIIAIDLEWLDHPQVKEWRDKGHEIIVVQGWDIILSKKAWNWDDTRWQYAEVALKSARAMARATQGSNATPASNKPAVRSRKKAKHPQTNPRNGHDDGDAGLGAV